jgi:L-seryl-tRNA(Ser) seleniumtransferase
MERWIHKNTTTPQINREEFSGMDIYGKLDVSPIINAAGTLTRLGGTVMLPEVKEAMAEAGRSIVPIDQLQAAASAIISRICGSEAGYIVSGAAAGLTLATAACMVGLDITKMDQLPFPKDVPDEIIISRSHRNSYDHAYRAAGAKLVEVGVSDRYTGAGVRDTEVWEMEAAISKNTAAITYTAGPNVYPPLSSVTSMSKSNGIPVIVDAAAQLPPPSNLQSFITDGADIVIFSGGKAIRGPQGTGIIAGRRDLIASMALQHLDMDVAFELWNPPQSLIPKDQIKGAPRHGIGRGFKVSKEQIVGAIVALEHFTEDRCRQDREKWQNLLSQIETALEEIPHLHTVLLLPESEFGFPLLKIQLDESALGKTAWEVAERLKKESPPIHVGEMYITEGVLMIHPINLNQEAADTIITCLKEAIRLQI